MDTAREVRRDQWHEDHREMCGTCQYHKVVRRDTFVCNCEDSEYYGDYTEYEDGCGEYIERR